MKMVRGRSGKVHTLDAGEAELSLALFKDKSPFVCLAGLTLPDSPHRLAIALWYNNNKLKSIICCESPPQSRDL